MKKTIYMVRHGETEFNKQVLFQGLCDSPLSDLGIKQAKRVGEWFKENHVIFDDIFISPSGRCKETLRYISKQNYTVVDGLHEMAFGKLEGTKVEFPYYPSDKYIKDNGGENYKELEERSSRTIKEIVNKSQGDNILILAHSGVFSAFTIVNGDNILSYESILSNSSILIYQYEDGKYVFDRIVEL